jgi:hypothetical protein
VENVVNTKEKKLFHKDAMKIPDHPEDLSIIDFQHESNYTFKLDRNLLYEFYKSSLNLI